MWNNVQYKTTLNVKKAFKHLLQGGGAKGDPYVFQISHALYRFAEAWVAWKLEIAKIINATKGNEMLP